MEIRELAKRVLFGETFAEKLLSPDGLSDEDPGRSVAVPSLPGRPRHLRLGREDGEGRLSGLEQASDLRALEGEAARGRLLHRFANHELLALELMALVLLRFPDAPPAFRLGLAHTLREEQEHLSLYVGRMQALGVELGELPLSDFFWNVLSGVDSPLAFVTAMSLTFEQANLDYAAATARALEAIGDHETAGILWRVHDEEIGHVRLGYDWFQRWRPGAADAWSEYRLLLPAPLTPGRAKGHVFSAEARRAAGIDERFLRELRLHSGSKGRVPDVFAFHPTCEEDLARGRAQDPLPAALREQVADLAPLLAFVTLPGDVVLVPRLPSLEHRERLDGLGVALPDMLVEDDAALADLAGRRLARIRPWGWSPGSKARLAPLLPQAGDWAQRSLSELRAIASKATAAEILRAFLRERAGVPTLCAEDEVGQTLDSERAVLERAHELLGAGHRYALLKAPWGTSGRGAVRLEAPGASPPQLGWLRRVLAEQEALVVEPWLEGLADLSCQVDVAADGAEGDRVQVTQFLTDRRGQYLGHLLSPTGRLLGLGSDVLRAVHGDGAGAPLLDLLREAARVAARDLAARGYRGPLGVDALLYRDLAGAVRLKPILELNPRLTMGALALGLARQLAPGRVGVWRHLSRAEWERAGHADAAALAGTLPSPRSSNRHLSGGVLCTNDPSQATARLALLSVGPTLSVCWEQLQGALPAPTATPPE